MEVLQWRQKRIDEIKAEIKADLDEVEKNQGPDLKLQTILGRINDLEASTAVDDAIRRFVFTISALNHHRKFGGLTSADLNNLTSLAYAILRVNGIKPVSSKLAGLFGEVHLMLSEIALQEGRVLEATMEQRICLHLSGESPPGGKPLQDLLTGLNALRLGNTDFALKFLEQSESGLTQANLEQARIARLRSLRFAQRYDEARTLLAASESMGLGESFSRELTWEKACLDLATRAEGDPSELIDLTYKHKTHFEGSYVLEAFFWTRAVSSNKWFNALPKLKTLAQKKELSLKGAGIYYKFAQELESAYDNDIPYSTRLADMKRLLRDIRRLRNIDKELLVWLSFSRWLYRTRSLDLAGLMLLEYRALSLRLTGGKSPDSLKIASDLSEKDWLRNLLVEM